MTDNHPITPPQWQVDAWCKKALAMGADVDAVFLEAARWGADQELEECCNWLNFYAASSEARDLRAARRPKPPSLSEPAIAVLDDASDRLDAAHENTIRRALERLQELEGND